MPDVKVVENVPLEVPTIIPPGEIAHLLLSAEAESAIITTKVNLQFTAEGGVTVPGDVDGDGGDDDDDGDGGGGDDDNDGDDGDW